jgi:hypothetical protein
MHLKALFVAGHGIDRQRIALADAFADGTREALRQRGIRRRTGHARPEDELIAAAREPRQPFFALVRRQMIEQRDRARHFALDVAHHHVGHRIVAFAHRQKERERLRERQPDDENQREPREQRARPVQQGSG